MNLTERGSGPEGLGWRCPRKGCRKEASLRVGTFFEGIRFAFCNLSLKTGYSTMYIRIWNKIEDCPGGIYKSVPRAGEGPGRM